MVLLKSFQNVHQTDRFSSLCHHQSSIISVTVMTAEKFQKHLIPVLVAVFLEKV